MRATRLISILLLLQTRGRLTARELADTLEVSVRTIYRDIDALAASGVPLYGEPGHDGGYRLIDGYHTRLTGLTPDEAEFLFLAGLPQAAEEIGVTGTVTAAQLKLLAALPPPLRDRAERIQQRFHLDTVGWSHDADHAPHLTAVLEAVRHQHVIRISYRRWAASEEVTRTLQPLGLVLKAGRWYLVASRDGMYRTYRISQITDLRDTGDRFTRPASFDLASYWRTSLVDFEERRYHDEATVRLSPSAIRRLPDILDPLVAQAAQRTAGPPDPDGWISVVIPIHSVERAVPELLRFGADADVLGPPALRERFRETVAVLADRYRLAGSTN